MSAVLRTPDERFAGLPGYPFAPHYVSDLAGSGRRLPNLVPDHPDADGAALEVRQ